MKKLLLIASLFALGVAAQAQNANPSKAKQEQAAPTQQSPNSMKETPAASAAPAEKSEKKECSPDEKKACGDMKKGKSCCSEKSKSSPK